MTIIVACFHATEKVRLAVPAPVVATATVGGLATLATSLSMLLTVTGVAAALVATVVPAALVVTAAMRGFATLATNLGHMLTVLVNRFATLTASFTGFFGSEVNSWALPLS